ncbi:MAG: hypothetical protein ACI93R_003517 [Flavobacteriales bacterium]|jgi:hypothetical protein
MSLPELPFSQACENNKAAIAEQLKRILANANKVFEIGSGTAQHADYFTEQLPWLLWQCSDRGEYLDGITARLNRLARSSLPPVISLDVHDASWPAGYDAIYSANTSHIMSWDSVQAMFSKLSSTLTEGGDFVLYGPFKYGDEHTSASNADFDAYLRATQPHQGIRDFEQLNLLAQAAGFDFQGDIAMPANNHLLHWRRV